MKLDFNPHTGAFFLRLPRGEGDPGVIMREHGLDFSETASTPEEAVLFTAEPYAAAAFASVATPAAAGQLLQLTLQIEASWATDSQAHIKCPPDQELAGFQKAGVSYALGRRNTIFGDVPGLGKTMQAICFANEIGAKRVLVICPANIRLQWMSKIRVWSTMRWPYVIYPIMHGRHGVHPNAAWTVVSYDLARTAAIGKALAKGTYDLIILDEAHYLKTIDTHRTRAVFGGGEGRHFEPLAERAGAILALTGTPLPNRPREAYTLLRGMNFDAIDWMSEDRFTKRFNPSVKGETPDGRIYIDERTGRHGELQSRLRGNLMVRRMKHGPGGVSPQLKLPIFDIVQMEETGAVKQALAAECLLDIDPENLEGADTTVLGQIATVRRLMGLAIAPQAADYIQMLLEGGEEKLVVFAWHRQVLDLIQQRLGKYGVIRIDGSTGSDKKQLLVDAFVDGTGARLLIGNLLSLGTGTDRLQLVADHAVLVEPDWTPGNNQQAVDRLDRMGQEGQVQADFLVAPGSILEKILASALRKNLTVHKALDRRL
jgi:SWI/SNF-related matrix-associated actin-dependent regulator 1 of chromatin subfamily A